MARNKKNRKKSNLTVKAPAPPKGAINPDQPPVRQKAQRATSKAIRAISIPTFLAGMFLTLVLGIYLGTILPDLHSAQSPATPPAPPSPPPQQTPVEDKPVARPQPKPLVAPLPPALAERIEQIDSVLQKDPTDAAKWIELGNLYFDANDPDNAVHAYEHALELEPDNPDVLTDMGIMYRDKKEFGSALECFRKAVKLNPGHLNAIYNEGVVLAFDLHDKEGAARAWERLLSLKPDARAPGGKPVIEMLREIQ